MLKIEVKNRCVGVTSAGSTHEMLKEMTWAVASFLNSIELKRPDGVTKVTDEEAIVEFGQHLILNSKTLAEEMRNK